MALASTWLAGGCTSIDQASIEPAHPTPTRDAASTPEPVDAAETPDTAAGVSADLAPEVEAAIGRALADGWQDLRIVSECITEAGPEAVEIFGHGVAVWGKKTQFALTHDQIRQLLEAFREAGFAGMEEFYGGRDGSVPPSAPDFRLPPPDGGASPQRQPRRITCRVTLTLDGVSKQAAQMRRGRQQSALRQLAERILDACREPASSGVGAADLADALAKATAGELAPETVEVMLHRKPERGEDAEGFLLRIENRQASSRTFRQEEGYGDPRSLELDADDFQALMQLLAEQGPGELPVNLWAEHYTDLTIQILNQRKNVQARRFSDMTPTQHGENQERFERIVGKLYEIHLRVMAEGLAALPK